MGLCNILEEREIWQERTFERIKSKLVSVSWNPQFKNAGDHPIVTIYSEPQIGKTTLILTMIGLKEDQIQNVYDTLRGDVKKGNSSTATATIYQKSENDFYGFSSTSIEDVDDSKEQIEYCEETEVKDKIGKIRDCVENDQADEGKIQYIYIPAKYFKDEKEAEAFSIIDMPGVRSRNVKEEAHVKKLMEKYIPISSVCIMACNAMQFVGMQSEELPKQINWKMRDDKFIIVTTKSYIADTTKSYFKQDRSQRKQKFYDYIKESTDQLFKDGQFLPQNSKMEIYPLDIGDSFQKLCKEEIKDKEDVEELKDARDRLLQELRTSISNHKGNKLKAAVKELRESVSQYGKEEEDKICKKIQRLENKTKSRENGIRMRKEILEELEEIRDEQKCEDVNLESKALRKKINRIKMVDFKNICDSFWNDKGGSKGVVNNSVKIKVNNIEDKKRELINNLNNEIDTLYTQTKKVINDLEDAKVKIRKDNFNEKNRVIRDKMFHSIQYEMDELFKKKSLRFSLKINVSQWNSLIKRLSDVLTEELINLKKDLKNTIDRIQKEQRDEIDKTNRFIKRLKSQIEKFEKEKERMNEKKKELEDKLKKLSSIRESNLKIVNMYKKTAGATFREYRNEVVDKINDPSAKADEKMGYVLLLGIIDKDYSMIIGGIDGAGY